MSFLRKSQATLAYEAQVSPKVVKDLAAGKLPQFLDLYEIARALKVSPEYLAGYTDDDAQDAFALAYSREDLEMLSKIRALSPNDRESVMQIIHSLATSAASPRVNERRISDADWFGEG
ncbi:hypothetical protein [Novosphingobium humi]|uniref:hypothetical protein n=1 Tax=Novosphingobium humi TaxID=2282397 RepID=UPI0025B0725A|nr:hypothetical protein [Novosphingobium humi]WJS97224.1 hypothetical protein NYQ05_08570 [Novosphingobium humi]